jgi:uncharacterized protein YkwD
LSKTRPNLARLSRFLALLLLAWSLAASAQTPDPLASWNDGAAKKAIVEFVQTTTTQGSQNFVPPAERIATFDNDGTLWSEQPMYVQLIFALDRVKALAAQHPEWKQQEPFASLLKGDLKAALAGGEKAIAEIVMATHAGMTTEEFEQIVEDWLSTAQHPRFKRPYTELVYQPMLELLEYLRSNGFKTYIVSGGGIEFMRPWTEKVYGIPPEQVVGSSIKTKYEMRDGKPVLVRLPELDFIDDKSGKPIGINSHIGRRPIAAFGNSDGDREMLEWTQGGNGARLMMLVHHDDEAREWAYGAESKIGTFSDALRGQAQKNNWTVISMKNDWKRIFAQDREPTPSAAGKAPVRSPGTGTGSPGGVAKPSPRVLPPDTQSARSPGAVPAPQPRDQGSVSGASAGIGLNPQQDSVLERVNYYRAMAGLAPVAVSPRLLTVAQSHTAYLDSRNEMGHYETDKANPHYTGHSPFDRIDAVGYHYREAGEVVAREPSSHPPAAIDALITAIYHRFIILLNNVTHAGPGVTLKAHQGTDELNVTVDFGAETMPPVPSPKELTLYPIDGHRDVPVDFNPTTEEPSPMPDHPLTGFPVSLQVDPRQVLSVDAFALTEASSGNAAPALDAKLLTHAVDPETPTYAAALIPISPLQPGTVYRASFSGAVDGVAVSRTWEFTTTPAVPVTMSFASPAVAPGQTQRVALHGVDAEKGPYYVCYTPARLITSVVHETESDVLMTASAGCSAGEACSVTVTATYHSACADPFAQGVFAIAQ